jgi:4-hydroxybenzoate polyprenyltransferase
VVAVVATVAGATSADAARLGVSMTLLQFAIGAVNDLVDARADAGRKPRKPIPSRSVRPAEARVVAILAAGAGIVLAAVSPVMVALALVVLGIGLAYDLFAKGTAASWVPFAVGIPILPVYGWLGATGSLPDLFRLLVPVAAVAGAALAIGNALVDVERDQAAGDRSVALVLGRGPASLLVVGLHLFVAAVAVLSLVVLGAPDGWVVVTAIAAAVPLLGSLLGVLAARGSDATPRERAWEVQAVGMGSLAVTWVAAVTAAAPL